MLPLEQQPGASQTIHSFTSPKRASGANKIMDFAIVFLSNWYWFLFCLIVALVVAKFFLLYTPPVYKRSASILVKQDQQNQTMKFLDQTASDINDEVFMLASPEIMRKSVVRLDLRNSYVVNGAFHDVQLYGQTLPIQFAVAGLNDNASCGVDVTMNPDNKTFELDDFVSNGRSVSASPIKGTYGKPVNTPIGKVVVDKTDSYYYQSRTIKVTRHTLQYAINTTFSKYSVSNGGENSIISLSFVDEHPQRAEEILQTIIAEYQESWVNDRNQVSINTGEFIKDRLDVIENELGDVEDNISSFKSAHLIPGNSDDISSMYLTQASNAEAQATELTNQLYMARYVRTYLTNEGNRYQIIPANQGINSPNIGGQITEYNTMLMRRNALLAASSGTNPLVQDLDGQLSELRNALIASIDNHIASLNALLRSSQAIRAANTAKVASSPSQSKYLLSVERQQKVKESLYLYLLQKREENELTQAFTAYNTRVVAPPSGSPLPYYPVDKTIYLYAIILGLAIPGIIVFLVETFNTKVRGRKDLEELTIPFIGEIPYNQYKNRVWEYVKNLLTPRSKMKEDKSLHLVVKDRSRNVINEAFRVIRTNIEFMSAKGDRGNVIMFTSFNPNSGKTFVSTNLVTSFAIKNSRILVVDLDLRKCSLSAMVPEQKLGVADYLSGMVQDYHDVIVHGVGHENLDVLPVGTVAPNPTELLLDSRLDRLMEEVRDQYDYIFLDCPPVEIVADASIVGKHADMTIFVIRAEMFDKSLIPDLQAYYDNQRLPKMSYILNGTMDQFSYYGYHRYGSRYGYYGYGGYTKDDKE